MSLPDTLQRFVPNACEELFATVGFRAKGSTGGDVARVLARPQAYAAGLLEFSGESLSGRIILLGAFEFFATSAPRGASLNMHSARDWIHVRDWTMELTNQLIGRIKNRLCTVGVVVETRLPKALSGHALVVTVRERKVAPLLFSAGGHDVRVWFEANFNPAAPRLTQGDPLPEGEVVCF